MSKESVVWNPIKDKVDRKETLNPFTFLFVFDSDRLICFEA